MGTDTKQAELNERATLGRQNKRHRKSTKNESAQIEKIIPAVHSATYNDKNVALCSDASVRVIDRHGDRRMIRTDSVLTRELLLTQPAVWEEKGKSRFLVFILDDRVSADDMAFLLTQEFKFSASK